MALQESFLDENKMTYVKIYDFEYYEKESIITVHFFNDLNARTCGHFPFKIQTYVLNSEELSENSYTGAYNWLKNKPEFLNWLDG